MQADSLSTSSHFQRVIEELCKKLGLKDPGTILRGGKLAIDDIFLTFVNDEEYKPDQMLVYMDMGKPSDKDVTKLYKVLLKLNFELEGGTCGSMCLHPENEHIFFSFCFMLDEAASGEHLLSRLMSVITVVTSAALGQPKDAEEVKKLAAAAGARAKAARFMQQKEDTGTK